LQAEDGIRDSSVTGVQTCALPIYRGRPRMQIEWNVEALDRSPERPILRHVDRKSVVEGKSVDLGCRRIIKKNKYSHTLSHSHTLFYLSSVSHATVRTTCR